METSLFELLKLVGSGGLPVLFAILLFGIFYILVKLGPGFLETWNAQIKEQGERRIQDAAWQAKMDAKVDAVATDVKSLRGDTSDIAKDVARQETGRFGAVADADRILRDRERDRR